jgi:hypothetical protein
MYIGSASSLSSRWDKLPRRFNADNETSKDGRELRENTLHMLARNAQEGQRLTAVDHPFENVELSLDHTGSQPISARFNDAPQLSYAHRLRNAEALETFRGTLVNGMLQPNVRLGNGLRLSIKANILKPQITKKRRARNHEAKELRESVGLPPRAPAKLLDRLGVSRDRPLPQRSDSPPPATMLPFPRRPAPRRDHDLERREAQIAQRERQLIQLQQQLLLQTMRTQNDRPRRERTRRSPPRDSYYSREYRTPTPTRVHRDMDADSNATVIDAREKALAQEEELLRYKRKAWLLEQKLAAQTTGRPTPRRERYQRDRYQQDANVQNQGSQYPDWPPPGHEAVPDPQHGGSGDEFPSGEFDLDDSSPPKALETLRSRIRLPDRSTMRSNRTPRQR